MTTPDFSDRLGKNSFLIFG